MYRKWDIMTDRTVGTNPSITCWKLHVLLGALYKTMSVTFLGNKLVKIFHVHYNFQLKMCVESHIIFSSLQDFVPTFLENLTDDELKKEAKNEAKNDALSSIIKVFYSAFNKHRRLTKSVGYFDQRRRLLLSRWASFILSFLRNTTSCQHGGSNPSPFFSTCSRESRMTSYTRDCTNVSFRGVISP